MELRVETRGQVDVLSITGRLDLVSSSALKDVIHQRLADGHLQMVLDMERIDFINSSGLGALISGLRDVRLARGRLALAALSPYVDEIFEITSLKRVFDCYSTPSEAVDSFTPEFSTVNA